MSVTVDGLGLTYPQPGWVVLDAIRDRGLTGSVMLGGSPAVRVYADQGDIYWAEEVGAPSIGARLVDAGAVTAVQLERGAVRHHDVERLERLFERVPAIERDTVLVAVRALAEQSLVRIASQVLAGVVVEPYIHHTSGIHLWNAQHPVARRNEGGRAAMGAPPEPGITEPRQAEEPATVEPATVVVAEPSGASAPPAPEEPSVPDASVGQVPADPDDFSLVWNDLPTSPPVPAGSAATSPEAPRPVDLEATGDSTEATELKLGDDFEVRWPASSAMPVPSPAPGATMSTEQQHTPAWTPTVVVDVVHPEPPEPTQSLTEALTELIVLVDRDLAAVRHEVDDLNEAATELLTADEFIAVRGAIASADTGLLSARRRLIDHRLRDRSSRGSSGGSSGGSGDGLRTTAVSDEVDQFGVTEERDEFGDLGDGSPSLRRIMGNLRGA